MSDLDELRDRLRTLLDDWFGTDTADELIDMDFCPYVLKRLTEIGATWWVQMLQGNSWSMSGLKEQSVLIQADFHDWERLMLASCVEERSEAGLIKKAFDLLPEVRRVPETLPRPADDPEPDLKVVGGGMGRDWTPMIAVLILIGAAWITS